jgi:hypothetical protein
MKSCKCGINISKQSFINYKFLPGEYINLTFNDEDYEYSIIIMVFSWF